MRNRGGVLAAAGAVVLMLAGVAGCTESPASPLASDGPTKTAREPAFASMDEAFEAAVGTYQRYVDLWNQIAAEGGANPERLLEVMENEQTAAEDFNTFKTFGEQGIRVTGPVGFVKPRLMQYQDGASLIQMYACFDVSRARLMSQSGNDITPPEREAQVPLLVTFVITDADSVVISRSEKWDRSGIC